ncbi:tetratricopeptide repeat protein [Winogradskyella vidalii]|uniref:hypothetical protein n=1 Tax=Winogradskyella vidalii TaxID=2615024 RepID=UPI0015CC4710|nr:hypothetical protein [Winogradskyella vidalii]
MEEQDYIQFEAYLAGELPKDELSDFEERLKTDAPFKEAFQVYKDFTSHLEHEITNEQENSDFKANLDVISTMHFNKTLAPKVSEEPTQKSNLYKYAIAASVAVLIGVFVFTQFNYPTYEDFNSYEPISLSVRSSDVAVFNKAEQSFNAQNYEAAIAAFNTILEDDFSNLEIQLYKSIALVETNQFEEADLLFNKLSNGSSAYKDKAKWILALSYLKQERNSACIDVLKTIPEDAEDYESAQKLLNQLD